MKINLLLKWILSIALFSLSACKKEDTSPPKDYATSFKNTVWTGEFHYASKPLEPVSIEFKEGGQFTWHEWAGSFSGTWKIENDLLTISFPSGGGFTTTITSDDKMSDIKNLPANKQAMDNAVLNKEPDVSLDNTVWTAPNTEVRFKPGNKLDLILASSLKYLDLSYVRQAKSIRFSANQDYKWFTIYNAPTVMKGVNRFFPDVTPYPFQLTKQ